MKSTLISRSEWVWPEASALRAPLHEHTWQLQVLLSQRIHLNAWWILHQWVPRCSHPCVRWADTRRVLPAWWLFVFTHVDSRTCSLAHCQYGCEEVQGEIRCLCPSAGLQLGQDERTCVGEQSHSRMTHQNSSRLQMQHSVPGRLNHCNRWSDGLYRSEKHGKRSTERQGVDFCTLCHINWGFWILKKNLWGFYYMALAC